MFGGRQGRFRDYERRLRRLQSAYYDAPARDDAVILEYLSTLREVRREAQREAGRPLASPRLHLGCGGHHIEGWINMDLEPAGADVLADATRALPMDDASVAFVHCEDLIEHLDRGGGTRLLEECFRVLRPGGFSGCSRPTSRVSFTMCICGPAPGISRGAPRSSRPWARARPSTCTCG